MSRQVEAAVPITLWRFLRAKRKTFRYFASDITAGILHHSQAYSGKLVVKLSVVARGEHFAVEQQSQLAIVQRQVHHLCLTVLSFGKHIFPKIASFVEVAFRLMEQLLDSFFRVDGEHSALLSQVTDFIPENCSIFWIEWHRRLHSIAFKNQFIGGARINSRRLTRSHQLLFNLNSESGREQSSCNENTHLLPLENGSRHHFSGNRLTAIVSLVSAAIRRDKKGSSSSTLLRNHSLRTTHESNYAGNWNTHKIFEENER
uniref:Uncharacterized protein n=1 Tax=Parascaris equorum TaxID=6256 RepID=A0A914R6B8_PAREQ